MAKLSNIMNFTISGDKLIWWTAFAGIGQINSTNLTVLLFVDRQCFCVNFSLVSFLILAIINFLSGSITFWNLVLVSHLIKIKQLWIESCIKLDLSITLDIIPRETISTVLTLFILRYDS